MSQVKLNLGLLANGLIVVGVGLLALTAGLYLYSAYGQWQARQEAARLSSVTPLEQSAASATGRIVIPKISVDSKIVDVDLTDIPPFAVGRYQASARPGEAGNAVFWGHLSSLASGNVFADLNQLKSGDLAYILSDKVWYTYRVNGSKTVPSDAVEVMDTTASPVATLITCEGTWDWRTRDYPSRLVVTAELVSTSKTEPFAR